MPCDRTTIGLFQKNRAIDLGEQMTDESDSNHVNRPNELGSDEKIAKKLRFVNKTEESIVMLSTHQMRAQKYLEMLSFHIFRFEFCLCNY